MPATTSLRRRLAGLAAAALTLTVVATSAGASPEVGTEPDPIDVLVYSKPHGFSHTDSIVAGGEWFTALNADPDAWHVVNTVEATDLSAANLARFDVLVWNNSTGSVPLSMEEKVALVNWVRDGHGIVGVHSAGDSNYDWPEFQTIVGGQYDGHWYRFGGATPEPTRLGLIKEDPTNPLMAGVPADYDSYDETYKWQMDTRTDVHVLMSMDNTTIAQGGVYSYHQPITWCRPVGEGRSWYTNLGHDGALWSDPVFTGMVQRALEWTAGRMEGVDCSVPADPATGVEGADRHEAVFADFTGARSELSTYSGAMAVLTNIAPGAASVTYEDLDLTGARSIDVFATAQTIGAPGTVQVLGAPYHARIRPATGGTVEIHLDTADGPLLGSVSIPPAPGVLPATALPAELAPVQAATGPIASWQKLSATITETPGVHDIVLTFPAGPLNSVVPAANNFIGSLAWIALEGPDL